MTPIEKLIDAAKLTLLQQTMNQPGIDELRDALKAVESAKTGNRLELVEITEEEARDASIDDAFIIGYKDDIPYDITCNDGKWRILFTDDFIAPAKFFRLAHPAEMEQADPMVPLKEAVQVIRRFGADDDIAAEWTKRGYIQWRKEDQKYHGKIGDYYMGVAENCKQSLMEAIRSQLAKADPHAEKIKIGNEKWVKDGDMVYHITPPDPFEIEYVKYDGYLNPQQCFLTEAEAVEFQKSERLKAGWRETSDGGWVKPGEKCWIVGETAMWIGNYEGTYCCAFFLDPAKAAEFLKSKGGEK